MTEEELQVIETRANKAIGGPWVVVGAIFDGPGHGIEQSEEVYGNDAEVIIYANVSGQVSKNEAEFIAHARTDIPALITEVRRLQEKIDDMETDIWNDGMNRMRRGEISY